jgi:predicted methyltransferase
MRKICGSVLACCLLLMPLAASADAPADSALQKAVSSPSRDKSFVARDASRHPQQELAFFGLKPSMTVVEIWPGKGYWTQILAPYLHDRGTYYVALPANESDSEFSKLLNDKTVYGNVKITHFVPDQTPLAADGSVDAVLTFRNLHNWMKSGTADTALGTIFRVLKPGGVLGLEDHRGLKDLPQAAQTPDGYVQEHYAIDLARKAGFEFIASSPMNNNPKDTKRWPKGVWTLPPTYALGDKDHAKYEAIGEADNFVLLFRKPASK